VPEVPEPGWTVTVTEVAPGQLARVRTLPAETTLAPVAVTL
jgi:hypothetical protein